ncbi:MAG: hypothetical protein ACK4RV_05615 [Caulobacter sp.]
MTKRPSPRARTLRSRLGEHAGDMADGLFRLAGTLVQLGWDVAGEARRQARRIPPVAALAFAALAAAAWRGGRRR